MNMSDNNQPVLLGILGNNLAKIAERLLVTQNDLTLQQLKTWVVFISTLDTENDDGNNVYIFNAIDLAKRLAIDERKARGTIVANIFDDLTRKQIKYRGEVDKKGEQNLFTSNLVGSVTYNKSTHMIQLEIPRAMRPFLFLLKRGAYTSIDTKHVVALDTVFSVKIYIYLKTMERQGIFEIPLDEFRTNIGATAECNNVYADFKRRVIKPAVAEIRKHTDYKDFFIEDDGGRGRKATRIRYGFTPNFDNENKILSSLSPAAATICQRFSEQVQIVFVLATQHGFDPAYIEDKLDDIPDDVILANFHYVMYEIIAKDKKKGKDKGPDVYGKYFLTAVQQHWAEKANKFDEMLGREKDRAQNADATQQAIAAQQQDELINSALFYDQKAKEYMDKLTSEPFALSNFINENIAGLNGMAGKSGFSVEKALTGKKTYREHKILIKYITAKMTLNEINIPKQESLF